MILEINSKKYPDLRVLIDDEDYDKIKKYNWHIHRNRNTFYAISHIYRNGKRTTMSLHRYIMDFPYRKIVDHINLNGLDCRKKNLRTCTVEENMHNSRRQKNNTSGYIGVHPYFKKCKNKIYHYFVAQIRANGKQITLGYFKTPEKAHQAYCDAAKKYYGEFARTK